MEEQTETSHHLITTVLYGSWGIKLARDASGDDNSRMIVVIEPHTTLCVCERNASQRLMNRSTPRSSRGGFGTSSCRMTRGRSFFFFWEGGGGVVKKFRHWVHC